MNKNKLYKKYIYFIKSKRKIKFYIKKISSLAIRGDLKSQRFLYQLYYDGELVCINYALSLKWCRYACLQGDSDAQYLLGMMYEEGQGLKKNTQLSIKWKSYAAKKHHIKAAIDLGIIYLWGNDGIVENEIKALKWFRLAASKKASEGYYYLSYMYFNGNGVKKNFIKSYQYVLLALYEDDLDIFSLILRKQIKKELNTNKLVKAKKLYKNYLKKNYK